MMMNLCNQMDQVQIALYDSLIEENLTVVILLVQVLLETAHTIFFTKKTMSLCFNPPDVTSDTETVSPMPTNLLSIYLCMHVFY